MVFIRGIHASYALQQKLSRHNFNDKVETTSVSEPHRNLQTLNLGHFKPYPVYFTGITGARRPGQVQPLIQFDEKNRRFHLSGKDMEYFISISPDSELLTSHWGAPVGKLQQGLLPYNFARTCSWQQKEDLIPREYADGDRNDNRIPSYQLSTQGFHLPLSQFKYAGHAIVPGKPPIEGLPSVYVNPADQRNAQTLVIKLRDELNKTELYLNYTVFKNYNAVIRSARLVNRSDERIIINKLASFSADLGTEPSRLLKLSGASAREANEEIMDIKQGYINISSRLGHSGHEHNPFIAVMDDETTDTHGNAYGFALVYSGSYSAQIEKNRQGMTRVMMGLNPQQFRWKLLPGESFQTPECIGMFSSEGINGLRQQYHQLIRNHVMRGDWNKRPRPVLLNTWEAFGPNVNHDKMIAAAKVAREMGVELIVLDDGWFGGSEHPRSGVDGLGDWVHNPEKFPKGIGALARQIQRMGLKFGIWVEPEMVSPNSQLFKDHPEWIIRLPHREPKEVKHQFILDLGRKDVQDYLIQSLSNILDSGPVRYIKWDMNRSMSEVGSLDLPSDRQMDTRHRYMLGLYRVLDTLTKKYPQVLFEGCAGGGGRFDLGMLSYFPQIWASDNTDAVARWDIQSGFAQVYPPIAMGAHVSEVPNGQVGRVTSLKTRFLTAMSANMGLELDPMKLTAEEKAEASQYIALYKKIRPIIHHGTYQLLRNPAQSNWPAWMFRSKDNKDILVFAFQRLGNINQPIPAVKLQGLDKKALYQVEGIEEPVTGGFLMNIGLTPTFYGDFDSQLFQIKKLGKGK